MASVFITGCSRGIGLGLVKGLLNQEKPPAIIIATCHIYSLVGLNEIVLKVKELVGDKGLNVLINNAGIHRGRKDDFDLIDATDMVEIFRTNTVGPLMVTKALRPLLKTAAEKQKEMPVGFNRAAIINISSMLGSFGINTFGGWFEYRESKVALNMATFSLAMELEKKNEGIIAIVIHPGRVKTDMSASAGTLEVEDSVRGMLKVFQSLKPEHNGKFLQWDGQILPF